MGPCNRRGAHVAVSRRMQESRLLGAEKKKPVRATLRRRPAALGRRGAFFATDAFLAAAILMLLLIISGTFFAKKPGVEHLVSQAEDLATMLVKTKANSKLE